MQREGAGYRLVADPDDIDVHRFTRLIDTARRTGEAGPAVDAYDQALALWRAEPFVDFSGASWTVGEIARLTELRLAALAERADRMLTLGHYDQVVTDLEPIVAEAPTRERLAGQLMTALFNAGRQAEALDVFARTRRVLAEDLGIDPSRELRAVMEQILRQDPAITPAAPRTRGERSTGRAATRSAPVDSLPLRSTSFVGRDAGRCIAPRSCWSLPPGDAGRSRGRRQDHPGDRGRPHGARHRSATAPSLVRLAAVTEPAMLTHAVADALDVTIEGGTAAHRPDDVLVAHLRGATPCLCSTTASTSSNRSRPWSRRSWSRCPEVRIIATSREVLAVPGEVQLPVAPLPVPAPETPPVEVADVRRRRAVHRPCAGRHP